MNLQCKTCCAPLVGKQKSFCSYPCKYESLRNLIEFTCRYCGRAFTLRPSEIKKRGIPAICSVTCGLQWSEPIVRRMRENGEPLVVIARDHIQCNICGERLLKMGSQMKLHGVDTYGMGHLERNLVLGLRRGERAQSEELSETLVTGAFENFRGKSLRGAVVKDPERFGLLMSMVPLTDEAQKQVRIGQLKGALIIHERACAKKSA